MIRGDGANMPDGTLNNRDFERLSKFVYERCGINMTEGKRTMLESRVRRRMQHTGHLKSAEYCRFLLDNAALESEEEAIKFIDAVTVNKTDFFREPWHFDFLKDRFFPSVIEHDQRQIKIWSAACSTGAEAYTIAMVAHDFFSRHPGFEYFILSTDISTAMVERATAGRYTETEIEPIPPEDRKKHVLMSKDLKRREFRMAPHLRLHMAFARLNLTSDSLPVSRDYDVIFCRNVLIYFEKRMQMEVIQRLMAHLKPGGFLILGHSESVVGMDLPLMTVATTVFQKI